METKNEKKFYKTFVDGKMEYRMLDMKNYEEFSIFNKSKPCTLELESKKLVALNPDVDRSYGFLYTYKIVPDKTKRFTVDKGRFIHEGILEGDIYTKIKSN